MGYPYHFVSLSPEQETRRRELLNSYGQFAQLSILLLPLVYQLSLGFRLLISRLWRGKGHAMVKGHQSPVVAGSKQGDGERNGVGGWARLRWVMEEELVEGWGTRGLWVAAGVWAGWLMLLAVKDTGDDYLHVTRRFAIVAASQLPLHYSLALKSWSPIQYLTRLSHEELNPYHRFLGRIIATLMSVHAALYLNFYIQNSLLVKRIQDIDVILGITAITTALLINTTALSIIRTWSYRLFFYLHVILSITLLPVLYFHVSYLRAYILEAGAIYILLILQRNIDQSPANATIKLLPSTTLISITIPLPKSLASRNFTPGQHIYLGFPSLPQKLRINPFSIANPHPTADQKLYLVVRAMTGTTAMLADLAKHPQPVPLLIEGPYGSARHFPDLSSNYDRVLLVAGGVGATFTLPIYRDLLSKSKASIVKFVWSVKSEADAQWGVEALKEQCEGNLPESFELYVSRKASSAGSRHGKADESIELQEREGLLGDEGFLSEENNVRKGRPDIPAIVDEIFASSRGGEERVAVLVCGPSGLGKSVRREAGRWVGRGRDVFWHAEEFGW